MKDPYGINRDGNGKPIPRVPGSFASDTPRTDALLLEINEGRVYDDNGPRVNLCRQLERELTEARAALMQWIQKS